MSRFSTRTMKTSDWDSVRHFGPGEFVRPEAMGYEFMLWLDRVWIKAHDLAPRVTKFEMIISSSHRDAAYNARIKGAKNSSHIDVPCDAVDVRGVYEKYGDDPNWNKHRLKIDLAAKMLGCRRVGIYTDGSLHLDRTEDRRPMGLWVRVSGHP